MIHCIFLYLGARSFRKWSKISCDQSTRHIGFFISRFNFVCGIYRSALTTIVLTIEKKEACRRKDNDIYHSNGDDYSYNDDN